MARKPGTARFTAKLNIAVEPTMKAKFEKIAEDKHVDPSVVYRWALHEYLARNGEEIKTT